MFIDDDSVRVTVVDAEKNKVKYNGETTSLSPLAEKLRNVSAIQGASVFTYNGKKITDIAEETQWSQSDKFWILKKFFFIFILYIKYVSIYCLHILRTYLFSEYNK